MADQKQNFKAMFGGNRGAVDYAPPAATTWTPLPMPQEADSLTVVARKLRALAQIVEAGTSVAVHTGGFKGTTHVERSPVLVAKEQMHHLERQMYETWAKGSALPPVDWDRCTKALPEGAGSAARFAKHAAALDIIYNRAGTTPGNAAYFFAVFDFAVPLVTAVSRVEAARRDLRGGQHALDELELAEVQTLARAVKVANKLVHDVYAAVKDLSSDIDSSRQTLQQRELAIKAKLRAYNPPRGNTNDARAGFVRRPAIHAAVDFRARTAGSSDERTSLLAGTGLAAAGRQPACQERATAVAAGGGGEVGAGAAHVPDEVRGADSVAECKPAGDS